MSRSSVLIAVTSLMLVGGVALLANEWLTSPDIRPKNPQVDPLNSMTVDENPRPDPALANAQSPVMSPEASRLESPADAVTILDQAYDDDSPVAQSADTLRTEILAALLPRFRQSRQVVAEDQELLACGPSVQRILKGEALDGRNPKVMGRHEQREFSASLVLEWKTERELFDAFGGRVTSDEFGRLTAVGARASYLKEQHAKGAFKINDANLAAEFWSSVEASTRPTDSDVAEADFSRPWWLRSRR